MCAAQPRRVKSAVLKAITNDRGLAAPKLMDAVVAVATGLTWIDFDIEVRRAATRHLLDTIGVMIAGAPGQIATQVERVLADVRPAAGVPIPGRTRRADILDAAFLAGTAGHGIE